MDIRFRGCLKLCLLLLLVSNRLYADIKLPALLADKMVLQQDTAVTLWGWADPGETVQVTGTALFTYGMTWEVNKGVA